MDENENQSQDFYTYSGDQIRELEHTKIPKFLKWTYLILPIIGLLGYYKYWNGSEGWLDPNHWKALQIAARTTTPFQKPENSQEKAYIKSFQEPGSSSTSNQNQ